MKTTHEVIQKLENKHFLTREGRWAASSVVGALRAIERFGELPVLVRLLNEAQKHLQAVIITFGDSI